MIQTKFVRSLLLAGVSVAVGAGIHTAPAKAQERGLADIIVTAEKRSESLQRTPLAISAMDDDLIRERGIAESVDLGSMAPNLTTTTGPNTSDHLILHIRGIGESEPNLAADAPVSIYLDGAVIGRSTGAIFDVVELERVEVLRGPQGTLYGRNTTGGAVNFITRKPGDEFGVRLLGSYGNYNSLKGRITVDTGNIANSGFKGALTYFHKQRNGYVGSPYQGKSKQPGAYNNEAVRAALSYEDPGAFEAHYTFDWMEQRGVTAASQLAALGDDQLAYFSQSPNYGGTELHGPSQERLSEIHSEGTVLYTRILAHTLSMEAELSDSFKVRSITGFRTWKNNNHDTDLDGNSGLMGLVYDPASGGVGVEPVTLFHADNFNRQRQFSQEINFLGQTDRFEYVLGGFYFFERAEAHNPQRYTYVIPFPVPGGYAGLQLGNDLHYKTRNESMAVFGQGTYHLTDELSVTAGARYTKDEKMLHQLGPVELQRVLHRNFSKMSYAGSIQYQVTPELLVYGRVATGYKAGGFNPRAVNEGYLPETLTNFEAGFKSEFFDRRLRVNATGFYMKLKDKQVNQFIATSGGGAASVTVNAGDGNLKGFEIEVEALPAPFLRLNANYGYVDQKFTKFLIEDPDHPGTTIDIADETRFSYAAKSTFSGGAQLIFGDVGFGKLTARGDVTYRSRVNYNVIPRLSPFDSDISSPPVWLVDGRVALGEIALGGGEAEIALWGKNLTNKKYRISGIDFGSLGFATNIYSVPRTYGVDVRFNF